MPVFAGVLRTHFNASGALTAVNGTVIPDLDVDVAPSRAATDASATAIRAVSGDNGDREVFARAGVLMIYRTGLAQGRARIQPPRLADRGRQRHGHP